MWPTVMFRADFWVSATAASHRQQVPGWYKGVVTVVVFYTSVPLCARSRYQHLHSFNLSATSLWLNVLLFSTKCIKLLKNIRRARPTYYYALQWHRYVRIDLGTRRKSKNTHTFKNMVETYCFLIFGEKICARIYSPLCQKVKKPLESCLYLLSLLCHQHVLIIYILHNCRSISCCISVGMKYNQSPPSKEETGHFAGSRRCVKPLG